MQTIERDYIEKDRFNFEDIWKEFEKLYEDKELPPLLSEDDVKTHLACLCLKKLKGSKFEVHTEAAINQSATSFTESPLSKYVKSGMNMRIDLIILKDKEDIDTAVEVKTVFKKDYQGTNDIIFGINKDFNKNLNELWLSSCKLKEKGKASTLVKCYFCFVNEYKYGWSKKMKEVKEKLEKLEKDYPHIKIKSIPRNSKNL